MTERTNKDRAADGISSAMNHGNGYANDEVEDAFTDLLTDMFHAMAEEEIDPDDVFTKAIGHFLAERGGIRS